MSLMLEILSTLEILLPWTAGSEAPTASRFGVETRRLRALDRLADVTSPSNLVPRVGKAEDSLPEHRQREIGLVVRHRTAGGFKKIGC